MKKLILCFALFFPFSTMAAAVELSDIKQYIELCQGYEGVIIKEEGKLKSDSNQKSLKALANAEALSLSGFVSSKDNSHIELKDMQEFVVDSNAACTARAKAILAEYDIIASQAFNKKTNLFNMVKFLQSKDKSKLIKVIITQAF